MRKLILTTAAVAAAIAGAVAGEPSFGTFTDNKDGQTYKTVKIGKQTWMAQNINYQTESGSWCYKNSADSCKKYGRLYDWKTATTVCPKGWHLPDVYEWHDLVATAGGQETVGKKLKSKSGWNNLGDVKSGNGTDDYGFSALPGGDRGGYGLAGYYGNWWSATENGVDLFDDDVYGLGLGYRGEVDINLYRKSNGYSVRCVEDPP
ncbi:MAG: fibrobacter succinogenes major paralogous domain-containing protein [Chitinispirillales bacterium]|jgi:uncharacterized protein (TIGR02145 family)|nr:fibrobacter succinogenes major paralogous domain-containing protein [Chitinispirillales bacterium]